MTALIIKALYKNKINFDLSNVEYVNFDFLNLYLTGDPFSAIVGEWKSKVNFMLSSELIKPDDLDAYFIEKLNS
jgi:hypothetical protein